MVEALFENRRQTQAKTFGHSIELNVYLKDVDLNSAPPHPDPPRIFAAGPVVKIPSF